MKEDVHLSRFDTKDVAAETDLDRYEGNRVLFAPQCVWASQTKDR